MIANRKYSIFLSSKMGFIFYKDAAIVYRYIEVKQEISFTLHLN
jgi:hypothetical protein